MKKVKMIDWGYLIKKKYPKYSDLNNNELYFLFEDETVKQVEIYEPHGWFKHKEEYIVYGHENIKIFSDTGEQLANQYTR